MMPQMHRDANQTAPQTHCDSNQTTWCPHVLISVGTFS
jgi:hypothetical protein